MSNAATLTVKIFADISDFERELPKSTRVFLKTVDELGEAGKKLTERVTLPLVALGAVFAKVAADDQAVSAQLARTFGAATGQMETSIHSLMKTVPETGSALEQLAISTDTVLRSLGLTAPAAQRLTTQVQKLAGDLAAYNHVEVAVAENALEQALEGKTKGLTTLGIAISQADVKARAYQMGIAKVGAELTHTQTAEATWSLLLDKTKLQQGEAARTIDDDANAFKRLKQQSDEVAGSFGQLILPTAAKVVSMFGAMLDTLNALPAGAKSTIVTLGGIAAATGPTVVGIAAVTRAVTDLRGALKLLSGTTALAGLGSALAGIALAAGLVAIPIATVGYAFDKESEPARRAAASIDLYRTALDKLSLAQLKQQQAASQSLVSALSAKQRSLASQYTALPKAGDPGYDVTQTPQARTGLSNQLNAVATQAAAATAQLDAVNARIAELNGAASGGAGGSGGGAKTLADQFKDVNDRAQLVITSMEQVRSGFVKIPTIGDAWVASMQAVHAILDKIKDQLDPVAVKARETAMALQAAVAIKPGTPTLPFLQNGPGNYPSALGILISQMNARNTIIGNATPGKLPDFASFNLVPNKLDKIHNATMAGFQQVAVAIGDTLAQNLSAALGGRGTGAQIGGAVLGAGGSAFASTLFHSAGAGVGAAFGNAVIPVVGGIVGTVIGGLIGGLFGSHKHSVDQNTAALAQSTAATKNLAEELSNLPTGFKIDRDRFISQDPGTPPPVHTPPPPSNNPGAPGSGPGHRGDGSNGDIYITGPVYVQANDATSFIKSMRSADKASLNRGGRGLQLAGVNL